MNKIAISSMKQSLRTYLPKISEIQKSAEEELGNSEISDQEKYLLDQKIEVLKSIN